jgi:hypothetical protein
MKSALKRLSLFALLSMGCGSQTEEPSPQPGDPMARASHALSTSESFATASACQPRSHDGRNYLFCTDRRDWHEARSRCMALGYDLATIDDASENTWVVDTSFSFVDTPDFFLNSWWIGANDLQEEGIWRNPSGELATYTPFLPEEPNGGTSENCVHLRRLASDPYGWNDAGCRDWGFNFVCEAPACPAESLGSPTLVLNGNSQMTLECGQSTWVDPGASATDGCGYALEVHRYNSGQDAYGPGPNTSAEGSYSVQYIAWDGSGATVSALRTVHVDDRTAPTLRLRGEARMTHTCGSGWVDPGVEAHDACYGDISATVRRSGSVNGWVPGVYTVTYSVTDSGGNSAQPVSRTVEVVNCPW